jgi:DNA-binding response OmpR family regulator
VEDNDIHSNKICEFINKLNKPKIKISLIKDGNSAFEFIETNFNINLFILDIRLPGLSGDVILRFIRMKKQYLQTPVIILTTSHQLVDQRRCEDFDISLYLIKTPDLSEASLTPLKNEIRKTYDVWLKH